MSANLFDIVERFRNLRVLVLGETMLDSYLVGAASRLCREAPAPIVDVRSRVDAPGGAANTAANVRSLGAAVSLLSVIGDDADGERAVGALAARGVPSEHVLRVRGRETLAKQRVVAEPQMLLRFDTGDTSPVDAGTEEMLTARLRRLFTAADAVIVSDYAYGLLTPRIIEAVAQLQQRAPRALVVDARDLGRYRAARVTAVKPNFEETCRLLERDGVRLDPAARAEAAAECGPRLLDVTGAQVAAITLDTEGAVVVERGGAAYRTYAEPATHARAAGAGDTFTAALALAFAAGADVPAAAEIASAASAVVVGKDGTTTCSADELEARIAGGGKYLVDRHALAALVRAHREAGRRVVFTNGCFDIVHRGHVTYLSQAKALGDVLIVGLNDDDSVGRLKGPQRPVNRLEDRAQVLAALSCVDLVVPFGEDTPEALIRAICPDVFAKGGDYRPETLPEAPLVEVLGGEVRLLPYVEDLSTSGLIDRIRATEGAAR